LQLQDAATGETIAVVSQTGSEAEIAELVSRAGASLREQLGIADISASDVNKFKSALPANPTAARLYSAGLAKLRVLDALAARDLLEKAVVADPNHALSHAALAESWSELGYDAKAGEQAKQALDFSSGLPREAQLSIEGRYRELINDWPKGIEIYRTLYGFFPDNLNYGLNLTTAQVMSGRGQDAITTTKSLRRLPSEAGDDVRIDIAEAKAAGAVSDFKREQALAEAAANKARAMGASLLLAEALGVDATALEGLGQRDQAMSAAHKAQVLYSGSGDLRGAATTQMLVGGLFEEKGDWKGTRTQFEQALVVFRSIGDQRDTGQALDRIGNVLYDTGQLAEAESYYGQALRVDREIKSLFDVAHDLDHMANALDGLGELKKAQESYEEALAIFRVTGKQAGNCRDHVQSGRVAV